MFCYSFLRDAVTFKQCEDRSGLNHCEDREDATASSCVTGEGFRGQGVCEPSGKAYKPSSKRGREATSAGQAAAQKPGGGQNGKCLPAAPVTGSRISSLQRTKKVRNPADKGHEKLATKTN